MNTEIQIFNPKAAITQENPIVSRVKESFKQQKEEMHMRSLKPHQCVDPLSCDLDPCWVFEPDKIVGESYKLIVSTEREEAQIRVRRLYRRMRKRNEKLDE